MKKTYNLSIGNALFHVEEDAFEKLEHYLAQIKLHFKDDVNKDEILEDIEARIAEKFTEKGNKVITQKDVEMVMEIMGTVEQFDGQEENEQSTKESSQTIKQLYRDPENAIIGGVSSGLGHFFGVDPIIFRAIFLVSVFLGGTGVIAYIILWIVVPEARTTSQKLSMKGSPVTVAAMAEMMRDKIEEVNTPEHKNNFMKAINLPFEALRSVAYWIKTTIFPAIRVVIGAVFLFEGVFFAALASVGLMLALFVLPPDLVEAPFMTIAMSGAAKILAVSLYLVALIPLIFIGSLGMFLIRKKNGLSKTAILILLSVWFVAIVAAGVSGTKVGMNVANTVRTDPYYKTQSQVIPLESFTKLVVTNDQTVRIVQGDTYSLEIKGRAEDITKVTYAQEDGTLTLGEIESEEPASCILCDHGYANIVLTVPTLSSITLTDSSRVTGDIEVASLAVALDNSSSVEMNIKATTLTATLEDSSRAYLSGTIKNLTTTNGNSSRFDADKTEVANAVIKATNGSHVSIYVTGTLNATALNASHIEYMGMPTIIKNIDPSSKFENMYDYSN